MRLTHVERPLVFESNGHRFQQVWTSLPGETHTTLESDTPRLGILYRHRLDNDVATHGEKALVK